MILAVLLLFSGLTISAVAIYYSVMGLMAIFSAAAIPIMIMGISLEIGKLVTASWVKQHWSRLPVLMKSYAVVAVAILMVITSLGIFGFLSKAHSDQTLVSGDVQSKIAIYDEKIKTAKENIEVDRKQIKQMDDAVDQIMGRSTDEKGADKANVVRKSQQKDRQALARDIESNQKTISQLNDEAAPIRAENRKVEAEVGPIKYIAAFVYGDNPDASILERAVTWVIILIVIVFDPLAVVMLLAAQMTFGWVKKEKEPHPTIAELDTFVGEKPTPEELQSVEEEHTSGEMTKDTQAEQSEGEPPSDLTLDPCYKCGTPLIIAPGIGPFCPNKECDVADAVSGETIEFATELPKPEPTLYELHPYLNRPWGEGLDGVKPLVAPLYPEDNGALAEDQLAELAEDAEQYAPTGNLTTRSDLFTVSSEEEPEPEFEIEVPVETAVVPEPTSPVSLDELLELPAASDIPVNLETAQRKKAEHISVPETMHIPKMGLVADNEDKTTISSTFGIEFPSSATKGDLFLRVDFLPNKLFRFNGFIWIEIDKSRTDSYTYDEQYIQFLIQKLSTGEYELDQLSASEQELVEAELKKLTNDNT